MTILDFFMRWDKSRTSFQSLENLMTKTMQMFGLLMKALQI